MGRMRGEGPTGARTAAWRNADAIPPRDDLAGRSRRRRIQWAAMPPFVAVHLACFGAFWSGVTLEAAVTGLVLYLVRVFAVTAGYHRYFSHRTYRMGRVMQLLMAFVAETSSQRGVLWWAAHHRAHHLYSDTERDRHSPRQRGFLYAHVLWIYDHNGATDWARVRDLARFPELRLLDRFWIVPPVALAVVVFLLFGWSGLFIGFCLSTVLVWHSTFTINSLSHVFGKRRYETGDDSRNNWLLAILTMGEGWHNNHHYYPRSCRQGFFPWEHDVTYYVLKAMSWVGLVSHIAEPPRRVLEEGRRADRARRASTAGAAKLSREHA